METDSAVTPPSAPLAWAGPATQSTDPTTKSSKMPRLTAVLLIRRWDGFDPHTPRRGDRFRPPASSGLGQDPVPLGEIGMERLGQGQRAVLALVVLEDASLTLPQSLHPYSPRPAD